MNGNGQIQPIIEREGSVRAGDLPYIGSAALTIHVLPGLYEGGLPAKLAPGVLERSVQLLATLRQESFWGAAVGIAVSKFASKGWEIESDVPLRRKRFHSLILNAAAGTQVGWGRFCQMFAQSYLCTHAAIVEIARESASFGSRITGLHHLDPLRCLLTGDAETPVIYRSQDGKWHELKWWQVGVFTDMPDVTEANGGAGLCAAERAYPHIRKLSAIERYVTEKVTGERPLAIHFVSGVSQRGLEEATNSAKADAARKGYMSYMGATVIPTLSNDAVSVVTVPLAELPDGFNRKEEFDIALLAYANNLGLDPQDLQPLTGQQLGAGAQSQILDNKSKGRGLALLQQMFAQWLNEFVLDDKTVFTWYEKDLRDDGIAADNMNKRATWVSALIDKGVIDAAQGTNLLVDYGDLPTEYIETDVTQTGDVADDEKPEMAAAAEDEAGEGAEMPDALKAAKKPRVTPAIKRRADKLFDEERARARRLVDVIRGRDE